MKYDNSIKSASNILETFFSDLLEDQFKEYKALDSGWQKVLLSLQGDGEKMASHSKIIDLKNQYLYVETDHPAWIQLFQLRKKKILIQLKKYFPSLEIKEIFFTLKKENNQK